MKRDVLFVLFVVMISILAVSASAEVAKYGDSKEILGNRGISSCKETKTSGGATKVYVEYDDRAHEYQESRCIDYNNLVSYSCADQHPTKSKIVFCKLRCSRGACIESFNALINKDSSYLKDKPAVDKRKEKIIPGQKGMQESYQTAKKIKTFVDEQSQYKRIYSDRYVCSETDDADEKASGITTVYGITSEFYKETYQDRCKGYNYKYEYSCKNAEPTVPSLQKCDLRCVDGECLTSFAKAVELDYKFTKNR